MRCDLVHLKLWEEATQMKFVSSAELVMSLLAKAFTPFGSDAVVVNFDVPRGPHGSFTQFGLPERLSNLFSTKNYLQLSPVRRLARSSFLPALWTQDTWTHETDPRAREVMQLLSSFGFREGCVIPVRGPHGLEADVSLTGRRMTLPAEHALSAYLLAYCGFARLCDLLDYRRHGRLLTRRDQDVLLFSARGLSTAEIAKEFGISDRTVEEHVRHACRRLGAANRTQAVAIAVRNGLI
jgi:LuxR family transcriptional regulator, quorum-sensing system regulator BjaR1